VQVPDHDRIPNFFNQKNLGEKMTLMLRVQEMLILLRSPEEAEPFWTAKPRKRGFSQFVTNLAQIIIKLPFKTFLKTALAPQESQRWSLIY